MMKKERDVKYNDNEEARLAPGDEVLVLDASRKSNWRTVEAVTKNCVTVGDKGLLFQESFGFPRILDVRYHHSVPQPVEMRFAIAAR
jgi:hypothetical protein